MTKLYLISSNDLAPSHHPAAAPDIADKTPSIRAVSAAEPADVDPQIQPEQPHPAFRETFSMTLLGRRYFVDLRIGSERREPQRQREAGQVRLSSVLFVYCIATAGLLTLFGTICLLYLMKSGLGINLMDGPSPLHGLY